jgi:(S)-sulfolactate dehydrogenase
VGIVGLGNIGRRVARIYRYGFGAAVLAYDPALPGGVADEPELALPVETLDELLERADVISIHAALSGASRHLIGAAQLARMKAGSVLVNTARGGVVDEAALARALRAGHLLGAGIDVFESEPPDPANELLRSPRVVLSPHIAGLTAEAADGLSRASAAAVVALLGGDLEPAGLLNPAFAAQRRGDRWSGEIRLAGA